MQVTAIEYNNLTYTYMGIFTTVPCVPRPSPGRRACTRRHLNLDCSIAEPSRLDYTCLHPQPNPNPARVVQLPTVATSLTVQNSRHIADGSKVFESWLMLTPLDLAARLQPPRR